MPILTIDGKPANTTLKPEEKDHHPERVMRRRQALEKAFDELKEGWMKDNGVAPNAGTVPNEPAIDRHYDERWREQCRVADNAQEAVTTQPDRMQEWIKQQREEKRREEEWTTPLHKITSLDDFSFRLVGVVHGASVWINSHLALEVHENGRVRVLIPDTHSKFEDLLQRLTDEDEDWFSPVLVDAIDYTPKELFALMGAMRMDKVTHPTEHELRLARDGDGCKPTHCAIND